MQKPEQNIPSGDWHRSTGDPGLSYHVASVSSIGEQTIWSIDDCDQREPIRLELKLSGELRIWSIDD